MDHSNFIVREGWPFVFLFGVLAVASLAAGSVLLTALLLLLTVFCTWFFRNPERKTPDDPHAVVSPADGRVIKIEDNVVVNDMAGGSFKKVSIFMNIFNVHVNRLPCSGQVVAVGYKKGKFLSANLDKASDLNEKNSVLIRMPDGRDLIVVQIAGLIARRIVCWITEGMTVERGDRFGLIRFGSRLEVFLPCDARLCVEIGDKVKAGESPIGYWP
ncbi:MAG: phosphatidylserine decarboxylase family protein [Deltaproteobacteria bacterium]|nr:phosphatidylserine decarboxylase family protein [Deltaproteobacteria bacterium]